MGTESDMITLSGHLCASLHVGHARSCKYLEMAAQSMFRESQDLALKWIDS